MILRSSCLKITGRFFCRYSMQKSVKNAFARAPGGRCPLTSLNYRGLDSSCRKRTAILLFMFGITSYATRTSWNISSVKKHPKRNSSRRDSPLLWPWLSEILTWLVYMNLTYVAKNYGWIQSPSSNQVRSTNSFLFSLSLCLTAFLKYSLPHTE